MSQMDEKEVAGARIASPAPPRGVGAGGAVGANEASNEAGVVPRSTSGFPHTLELQTADVALDDCLAWLRRESEALLKLSRVAGAVLFRGFPLATDRHFDAFVAAFGLPEFRHADSLSNAVRTHRTERVFTANEAPARATIRLHHEMAQTPISPSRLFFFCERAPSLGGATSLCRSDLLYESVRAAEPAFAQACEERGLLYSVVMPPEDDPASALGRSWRSTFSVGDRAGAEARMRALDYSWAWLEGDCLRATTPVLPAVLPLEGGRKSFFNQLIAARSWKDARNKPESAVRLGNGEPLDGAAWGRVADLAEELTFDHEWRAGDVVLVDNEVCLHGRRPFEGERAVLASLVAPGP